MITFDENCFMISDHGSHESGSIKMSQMSKVYYAPSCNKEIKINFYSVINMSLHL